MREDEIWLFGDDDKLTPLGSAKLIPVKIHSVLCDSDIGNMYVYDIRDMFTLLTGIKNVVFNDPATVVFWNDGTKTVVKCDKEEYDPEKGLAMAIAKKALGNKGNYYEVIKKWVGEDKLFPENDKTAVKKNGNKGKKKTSKK